jgi:hypothetical protein
MPVWTRALFALLIAVLLTLAPFRAAHASHPAGPGHGMAASQMEPDCHGSKHQHGAPAGHDCCDHGSKSKCPDDGCGCASGCGAPTLAAFYPAAPARFAVAQRFETPRFATPPGLRLNPQGPPPKF